MEDGVQKALDSMLASKAEIDAKTLNDAMKVHNYECCQMQRGPSLKKS